MTPQGYPLSLRTTEWGYYYVIGWNDDLWPVCVGWSPTPGPAVAIDPASIGEYFGPEEDRE